MNKSSFLIKLTAIMLLLTLIPLISIGTVVYLDKINTAKIDLQEKLITNAETNSEKISEWITTQKQAITSIAKNKMIIEHTKVISSDKSSNEKKFNAQILLEGESSVALNAFDDLKKVLITKPISNEYIFYTSYKKPETIFLYDEKIKNLEKNQVYLNKIFVSKKPLINEFGNFDNNIPVLWITIPMYGEAELVANLSGRIDLEFQNILHQLIEFSSADGYIVDSNGIVISQLGFTNELMQRNIFEENPNGKFKIVDPTTNEVTQIIKNKNEENLVMNIEGYSNYIGNTVVGAINPIPQTDWSYVVEVDINEAFIEIASLQVFLVTTIALTILVVTGLSIYFSSRLFNPIKKLTTISHKVADGDLNVEIKSKGNDEIHELSESFNKMIKSLDKSIKKQSEAENKFRTLYNDAPTLNRTIDVNGKIIDCNDSYANRLGFTKKEVIGTSIFEHCDIKNKDKLEHSFALWKETGKVNNVEVIFKEKNGNTFPGIVSATSMYDEKGNLVGSNSVIIDISKIREAEIKLYRAEQKIGQERLLAIGELGARLAHDLRNPLSVIRNTLYLLENPNKSDENKTPEYILMINRAVDRINHQINNVLDFVRGNQAVHETVKIGNLIKNSLEIITIPSDIKIDLSLIDVKLSVDPNQIEVVFTNIIRNAIESIGDEKGEIKIEVIEEEHQIKINFSDSGPGIAEEELEKIFDPLYTTKHTGTGLGLASCKNIIEEHGGKIEIRNLPTTFTIILPKIFD